MIWAFCCGVFLTYIIIVLWREKNDNSVADSGLSGPGGLVEETTRRPIRRSRWYEKHGLDVKYCPDCGSLLEEAEIRGKFDPETGKQTVTIVKQCFATKFGGLMYKCSWPVYDSM